MEFSAMFEGIFTALITPFKDGRIDGAALDALIDRQLEAGVDGLVPCGTTGESATLSVDESLEVIARTVGRVAGRCKVVAGVGSNDTHQTIKLAKSAASLGVDGVLVITPYYNKPTQAGLIAHFEAVSDSVPDTPIMLYNVPGRTGVSLSVDAIAWLAKRDNIVALKEATADMAFATRIIAACGDSLTLLSGDDITALSMWAVGGRGVVSVSSNLVPERLVELWQSFTSGRLEEARRMHLSLTGLFDGLFIESNPVPVKTLVAERTSLCTGELRLPLVELRPESKAILDQICERLEIGLER